MRHVVFGVIEKNVLGQLSKDRIDDHFGSGTGGLERQDVLDAHRLIETYRMRTELDGVDCSIRR